MKVLPVEKTDLTVPAVAEMAKQGTVILTRNGRPLAAVKDLSQSDWETVSLANNPQFVAIIEASRRSYRKAGGIPAEEIRKELGLKMNRVRRPRRKSEGK